MSILSQAVTPPMLPPMPRYPRNKRLLQGARVYLSGPMDFVASRAAEKQFGWRNRVSQFLQEMCVTVFDPWFKPDVRGLHAFYEDLALRFAESGVHATIAGDPAPRPLHAVRPADVIEYNDAGIRQAPLSPDSAGMCAVWSSWPS